MRNYEYIKIDLIPTLFELDVWICNDKETLVKLFKEHYGASEEYYSDFISENQVATIYSKSDSLFKGETRIVMNLTGKSINIIVHEVVHVVYHLSKLTGLSVNYKSQEWVAYMTEYIFNQITKDL
jgi:hypothetical protein